jgi:hypothetical protein
MVSSSNTTGSRPISASSGAAFAGQPGRPRELGRERRWRRLDRAQIEAHDGHADVLGGLGERAQQRRLANPAGACSHKTLNGGSDAASASRNSSSSAARPANRRRRALFRRSATVDAARARSAPCRASSDIACEAA